MTEELKETEEEQPPKYIIDTEWYERRRRSFPTLLRSRIRLLGGVELEERLAKKKEGAILKALQKYKLEDLDFIPPDLPLMEAVFRVYLKEGNKPMTSDEIRDQLMKWWRQTGPYKDVEPHILTRMLDNDQQYGFRRLAAEGEQVS